MIRECSYRYFTRSRKRRKRDAEIRTTDLSIKSGQFSTLNGSTTLDFTLYWSLGALLFLLIKRDRWPLTTDCQPLTTDRQPPTLCFGSRRWRSQSRLLRQLTVTAKVPRPVLGPISRQTVTTKLTWLGLETMVVSTVAEVSLN